jgi:hypothetical protein
VNRLTSLLPLVLAASCGGHRGSGAPAAVPQVRILAPADTTWANGPVLFQVEIAGGAPDAVEVLVDDIGLFPLSAPWEFTLETSQFAEGAHDVVIRVIAGGRPFTSPPRRVVVDRTAPRLLARTPVPGRVDVAPSEAIVATFSEAVLGTSLTATSVRVNDRQGNAQTVTPELAADGLTLTLRVAGIVTPGELTVFLLPEVTDLAGNGLQVPVDPWTFQLPGWNALGGPLHGSEQSNAFTPSLALGPGDQVFLAWQDTGGGTQTTIHVQQRVGARFEPVGSALVADQQSSGAAAPSLQVDAGGRPVVAWEELGQDGARIHVARWDGAAWGFLGTGLAGQTSQPAASRPSLALDENGLPLVAFYERLAATGRQEILVQRWNGAAWGAVGTPFGATPGATDAFNPSLRYLTGVGPTVAFDEADGIGGSDVHVFRFDGSTWRPLGGPLRGTPGNRSAYNPSLAMRAGDDVAVAFSAITQLGVAGIQVKRWDGGTWRSLGTEVNAVPGLTGAAQPSLWLAADGTPFVAQSEIDLSDIQDVFVSRFDGMSWHVLSNALSPTPGWSPASEPCLVVDSLGVPVVAFRESRSAATAFQSIFVMRQNH